MDKLWVAVAAMPWWIRVTGFIALAADAGIALSYASSSPDHFGTFAILFGSVAGGSASYARRRDRAFWRLPGAQRRRVVSAARTGTRTGDPQLDELARRRLIDSDGQDRGAWTIYLGAVALPVATALRQHDPWWLLLLLPVLVFLATKDFRWSDPQLLLAGLSRPRPGPGLHATRPLPRRADATDGRS